MKSRIIISFLILAFAVSTQAQILKLSVKKEQRFQSISIVKTVSTVSAMGQEMENLMEITTTGFSEIKDLRSTEIECVTTCTRIQYAMSQMGQEMQYDSDKKENTGPIAENFEKILGKALNITIDLNGKVIKQDKPEEVFSGILMGSTVTADFYEPALLNKTMKTGAQWSDTAETANEKMKTTIMGIYTVKSIENNIATIVFTGTQIIKGTMEQQGMEMQLNNENKVTSTIKVDMATGVLIEKNSTVTGTGTVEAAGMQMPTKTNITSMLTVKPI